METTYAKIGVHIEKEGLFDDTIPRLIASGCYAAQVYLSNRISFNPGKSLKQGEIDRVLKFRKDNGFYLVCHGKLILNMCRDDPRNLPALICDLQEANKLGADVVIHQGKNVDKRPHEEALSRYVMNIQEAIDQTPELTNRILLENSCQQGEEMGYTLDDLAMIWRMIDPSYRHRIGFCLDLCHAHVGGMINMRDPDEVERVLNDFERRIGLRNLKVIHFNDSEIKFDGHNDSHADICMGFIGNPELGGNSLGFRKVVQYANKYQIPLIMEVPGRIPAGLQARLILGWTGIIPDYEDHYLDMTAEIRAKFTDNPKSRKGRKSTNTTATTAAIATSTTASTATVPIPALPIISASTVSALPVLPITPISQNIKEEVTEDDKCLICQPEPKKVIVCRPISSLPKIRPVIMKK